MIVFTAGTFDVPHVGHLNLIRQIRELFPSADIVVALNTDEFVTKYKGKAPLFSYRDRKYFLELFAPVFGFEIVKGSGADSRPAIIEAAAEVVAIGNDWLEKDYCKQMGFNSKWLTDNGISLVYIPHTDGISTTIIKEKLTRGKN